MRVGLVSLVVEHGCCDNRCGWRGRRFDGWMDRYGTVVDGREEEEKKVRNKLAQRHWGVSLLKFSTPPNVFFDTLGMSQHTWPRET